MIYFFVIADPFLFKFYFSFVYLKMFVTIIPAYDKVIYDINIGNVNDASLISIFIKVKLKYT